MAQAWRDFVYAARGLTRAPGTAVIAVIALGMGIGLTTVMFSIVYGALHRGLPFEDADRIMHLERSNISEGIESMEVSIHDYTDWEARQRSFESLAAFRTGTVNIRGSERAERYDGAFITASAFEVLGVQPEIGRTFTADETLPGAPMRVILGYRAWQDRFGGSPEVLGQVVTINAEQGEIVGVMPEGFEFPLNQEVWIPNRLDPVALPRGTGFSLEVFGKLRDGTSLDEAGREFASIAEALGSEFPETNDGVGVVIKPYADEYIDGEVSGVLNVMLATVFLVLIIACVNVANLLLARASVRTRDMAIRTAIGASRFRVLRQVLAESVVLAMAGSLLGVLIAWVGIGMFARAVAPTDPPFWLVFKLDLPILGFVVLASAIAAVASGLLPAWRASATDVNAVLKDESRGSSSLQMGKLSRVLVIGEIAMSLALLFASGLMVRGVTNLNSIEYPFASEGVFTARIGVFPERYPDNESRMQFWDEVEERVQALPGAESVALSTNLPGKNAYGWNAMVQGESYQADRDIPFTWYSVVSASFAETFEVTPVRGRWFTDLDGPTAPAVMVVNESFVAERFDGVDPIGRSVTLSTTVETDDPSREIIGVVPDLFMEGIGNPDDGPAGVYIPLSQWDASFLNLAVRTRGDDALSLTAGVRDAVAATDPDTPIYWVQDLQSAIAEDLWFYRVFGGLFFAFGLAALFLASVGLYGVMSFSVGERTREMGVRMALGAQARQVQKLVIKQGVVQILIGVVIGSGLAWAVASGLTLVLYEVSPWDPATFLLVCVVLFATGILACLVPALRATRVDPAVALYSD